MMKMTYEEFKDEILNNTGEFIPETIREASLEIRENEKLNNTYEALLVSIPGQTLAASVNLNNLYDTYTNGSMDYVYAELRSVATELEKQKTGQLSEIPKFLRNYDDVKDNLYIRCSNSSKNRSILDNCPYYEKEGLAMTAHVGIDWEEGKNTNYSVTVNNQLLSSWGVDATTVLGDAVNNAEERLPVSLRPLSSVIGEMMGVSQAEPDVPDIYVMTNSGKEFGASVAFYPDVLKQVYEKLGSCYMLPSSIHEWLVMPDAMSPGLEELETMVREVNRSEVKDEDFLSDEVYHYDGEHFEMARDYENRIQFDKDYEQFMNEPDYEPEQESEEMTMEM